ncbi:MAG: L-ribulose-5-phosphate 4-epimerase SgbE [candidate division BRC1 bacterium ADurb.BinA364]|nr:MAG: L-ribulose-5-phosphate 4-epimerase SgbE [candidate division BRC1 bacterium ADurb.BinA364]
MGSIADLKTAVCEANLDLVRQGLVIFTWGNASGIDRGEGLVAIKPSGVDYRSMAPEHMAVVRLADGQRIEGEWNPSSDTPTHLALYRAFEGIGGIAHTHSPAATAWAQACGAVPCAERMTAEEIFGEYEAATGEAIVRRFRAGGIDPRQVPAVLVASHGPFAWGETAAHSVVNAKVLEECCRMALDTLALCPEQKPIAQALLDKHFLRKHGPGAYYGQR